MATTPPTPTEAMASLTMSNQQQQAPSSSPRFFSSRPSLPKSSKKNDKKIKLKAEPNAPKRPNEAKPNPSRSVKLRGMEKDPLEVRVSKTLSWLLRHGAQGEGLPIRKDGYVKVLDLLEHPKLKSQGFDLEGIKGIVKEDKKQRYELVLEDEQGVKLASFPAVEVALVSGVQDAAGTLSSTANYTQDAVWWIKARQGHSIQTVQIDLKPIALVADIPTGIAVHGTNRVAWEAISKQGLSKMKRNHIHLAQNVAGDGVISGMRSSSKILIYIDVQSALDVGIKFWLSDNGVVLTEGDEQGFLPKRFFERVVNVNGEEIMGWR